MKVLQINKFLYRKGGAEEYMFQLTDILRQHAIECTFWGMADEKNIVADEYGCFADHMDFVDLHGVDKITGALNTIYSRNNRQKIGIILDAFKPDLVHLHNYNFQLTASILPEIKRRGIKIVHTAHDSQMVCPYHRLYNFEKQHLCEECVGGKFYRAVATRCFGGSILKSAVGAVESYLYHGLDYYNKYLDVIVSPGEFLASYLRQNVKVPVFVVPNFTKEYSPHRDPARGEYVLYFGRISPEKGICDIQGLPVWDHHRLVIVGDGPQKPQLRLSKNIEYIGPKYGEELRQYIADARYVIQPSKWYENCPMTVIESFMCGTPVIAANKGGFVDMIKHGGNGFLLDFESRSLVRDLELILETDPAPLREHCRKIYRERYSPPVHIKQIMDIYQGVLA